jgi:hypothetical protein
MTRTIAGRFTPTGGLDLGKSPTETHGSRAEAMQRERFLKTGKGRQWIKENLAA